MKASGVCKVGRRSSITLAKRDIGTKYEFWPGDKSFHRIMSEVKEQPWFRLENSKMVREKRAGKKIYTRIGT